MKTAVGVTSAVLPSCKTYNVHCQPVRQDVPTAMGIINYSLFGFEAHSTGKIHAWYCKESLNSMAGGGGGGWDTELK